MQIHKVWIYFTFFNHILPHKMYFFPKYILNFLFNNNNNCFIITVIVEWLNIEYYYYYCCCIVVF